MISSRCLPWLLLSQVRALRPLSLSKTTRTLCPFQVAVPGQHLSACLQLRRARAWFPCVDAPDGACAWDLRVTVPMDCMAVSSGQLIKQVTAKLAHIANRTAKPNDSHRYCSVTRQALPDCCSCSQLHMQMRAMFGKRFAKPFFCP